ncbi:hypothetical protein E4U32_003611 [Claviceps aff. humidiphila group G2b]|nr:hypothetical protein E4U32_003611 [Claviceps aff. humidiphila group G2b]
MLRSPPRISIKAQTYVRAAAELIIKGARVRAAGRASSLYAATVVSSQALDAIYAGELESGQFGGGSKAKKDKTELELHADGAWGFKVSVFLVDLVSLSR